MNNNSRFTRKRLSQVIAAAVLSGSATGAFAGEFALVDNKITWTLGSAAEATVDAGGVATAISIAKTTDALSLPNISFQLVDKKDTTDTFDVRLFMEV